MSRLASGLWVQAYLARLQQQAIPAYVTAKGDATAGAVVVKTATLDGSAIARQRTYDLMNGERTWLVLVEGAESEVDAVLAREKSRDRDLWIIEVEDRQGRNLLDEDGLSD